jgi:hypothetical protein
MHLRVKEKDLRVRAEIMPTISTNTLKLKSWASHYVRSFWYTDTSEYLVMCVYHYDQENHQYLV